MDSIIEALKVFGSPAEDFLHFQAMGGNVSIKGHSVMHVKASGIGMSPLTEGSFAEVRIGATLEQVGAGRPSMEAPMHASFATKFVFHSHWLPYLAGFMPEIEKLSSLSKRFIIQELPFRLPGKELSREIVKLLEESQHKTCAILFLKNHGIVVAFERKEELDEVMSVFHSAWQDFLLKTKMPPALGISQKSVLLPILGRGLEKSGLSTEAVLNEAQFVSPDFFLFFQHHSEHKSFSNFDREMIAASYWLKMARGHGGVSKSSSLTNEELQPLLAMEEEKYRMGKNL